MDGMFGDEFQNATAIVEIIFCETADHLRLIQSFDELQIDQT